MADLSELRAQKIAQNELRMQALGVSVLAEELSQVTARQLPGPAAKRKRQLPLVDDTPRKSGRIKASVNYNEELVAKALFADGWPKVGGGTRPAAGPVYLDDAAAQQARLKAGISSAEPSGSDQSSDTALDLEDTPSRRRGPQDSGKGVRLMAGKVYDSKFGVTCHWCRQKTLSESVTCTMPTCGTRRMPTSFCKGCLLNRHGEDWQEARNSGNWVCPPCRGSCGAGCVSCCNCGPCRKKLGLPPTGQVKRNAKQDGFENVHDWLVFQATQEPADVIAARSALKARRGADPPQAAAEQPSRQGSNTVAAFDRSAPPSRPVSASMRSTAGQAPALAAGLNAAAANNGKASTEAPVKAVKADAKAGAAKPPLPGKITRSRGRTEPAAAAPAEAAAAAADASNTKQSAGKRKSSKRSSLTMAEAQEALGQAAATTPVPASVTHPASAGLASEPSPEQEGPPVSKKRLKPRQLHFSSSPDPLAAEESGDEMDMLISAAQQAASNAAASEQAPKETAELQTNPVPEDVFAAFVTALNEKAGSK